MSNKISVTEHLISSYTDLLESATEHPFLTRAGNGTLPEEQLCSWLVQDKYYQFAYIKFVGRLLTKINLDDSSMSPRAKTGSRGRENLVDFQVRALDILVGFLNALKRELDFYDETVSKFDLHFEPKPPNTTTEAYVELFEMASEENLPLLHGLVVLWATEFVYLKAWRYAHGQELTVDISPESKGSAAALRHAFIPNWASNEFEASVNDLGALINDWYSKIPEGAHITSGRLFERVLNLETQFWPQP